MTAAATVARLARRPLLRVETLTLLVSLWFTATANRPFWQAMLSAGKEAGSTSPELFAAYAVILTTANFIILALVLNRWTAKPLLALITVITALAAHYMQQYRVYLDPSMLRNVLRTDIHEAGELLSWHLLSSLLALAVPPLLLVWRTRIRRTPLLRAAGFRTLTIALALAAAGSALFAVFQEASMLMRQDRELRFLATPANAFYSLARVIANDSRAAAAPRQPVGTDAALADGWRLRRKPVLLFIVVGETARAANWGLSGYARQTTPELAALDVINFADVTACGTNTEVSVPCMFSPLGRRAHDERRIRNSESLLHVLQRAGFRVAWLDNQSGCKGVCDGIETWHPDKTARPDLCTDGRCLDEILLQGARGIAAAASGNTVLVLHTLGNHGPTYYRRYPAGYRHFAPACESNDLGRCSREEIINAYDNALLYTDHVLAGAVALLREHEATHDTALIYVSDHGESLGENGLFLHGVPYALAPKEQTRVPMVLWLSPGYTKSFALALDCLRQQAAQPAAHDHLFHTILGLLDVRTSVRDHRLDLSDACRPQPAAGPQTQRSEAG
jgi:lipid A ethanolaminephosphotransferase